MLDLEAVRQRLLGAWSLAAWHIATDRDRDEPGLPFGADAPGLLLYTADGWMNASIARSGRAALSADEPAPGGVRGLRLDWRRTVQRGTCQTYHEGPNRWWSEAPFAPNDGWQAEDDGYLVGFVWDGDAQKSKVVVMNAADIAAGPLCRITLPQRVPNGFHATWVSAERLRRGY